MLRSLVVIVFVGLLCVLLPVNAANRTVTVTVCERHLPHTYPLTCEKDCVNYTVTTGKCLKVDKIVSAFSFSCDSYSQCLSGYYYDSVHCRDNATARMIMPCGCFDGTSSACAPRQANISACDDDTCGGNCSTVLEAPFDECVDFQDDSKHSAVISQYERCSMISMQHYLGDDCEGEGRPETTASGVCEWQYIVNDVWYTVMYSCSTASLVTEADLIRDEQRLVAFLAKAVRVDRHGKAL